MQEKISIDKLRGLQNITDQLCLVLHITSNFTTVHTLHLAVYPCPSNLTLCDAVLLYLFQVFNMAFWYIQEVGSERTTAYTSFWYDVVHDARGRLHSFIFACVYVNNTYIMLCTASSSCCCGTKSAILLLSSMRRSKCIILKLDCLHD